MRATTRRTSILLLVGFLFAGIGFSATAATRDSNAIGVTARVMPYLESESIESVETLLITEEDVARGFVEVRAASTVKVRTNARHALVFRIGDARFSEVRIGGLEREVVVSRAGGFAPQPLKLGSTTYELDYRIALNDLVAPGTYEVPVSYQVRSLE